MNGMHRFTKEPCNTRRTDVWRLSQVRKTAMYAYKWLDREGNVLKIIPPVLVYADRLVITYDTPDIPHEWVRETLRDVENRIIAEGYIQAQQLGMELKQTEEVGIQ